MKCSVQTLNVQYPSYKSAHFVLYCWTKSMFQQILLFYTQKYLINKKKDKSNKLTLKVHLNHISSYEWFISSKYPSKIYAFNDIQYWISNFHYYAILSWNPTSFVLLHVHPKGLSSIHPYDHATISEHPHLSDIL